MVTHMSCSSLRRSEVKAGRKVNGCLAAAHAAENYSSEPFPRKKKGLGPCTSSATPEAEGESLKSPRDEHNGQNNKRRVSSYRQKGGNKF